MIWDTFAVDEVIDESAHVLLRLSPHASLYPSHLPYLFLRQMWYLLWKHKMLKMSTREQCQVLLGGKKAEYFERLRWECRLRYEEGLSILAGLPSTLKKWYVVFGKLMLRVKIADKLYPRKSGSRSSESDAFSVFKKQSCRGSGSQDSENGASSIFEKAILLGVWLLRFEKRCLFEF
ncbi:hypothetical protein EV1_034454 [Malus domestica]